MEKPQYIDWIVEETGIVIKDDIPLKCYKIDYKDDESILDDWALHIRRNYIEDTELKEDADDKQNYYTLLQNCICKSVETLDTKSIYKAFVKNGLMDRLQWKLTTKKLLELQK